MKPPKEPAKPLRLAAEIEATIRGLSDADLQRLEGVARRLMAAVRWVGLTQNHEDLLQEVITKTLSGERSWPQDVSMSQYFFMTMKSIRASWVKGKLGEGKADTPQKNATAEAENSSQTIEMLESLEPSPERVALARGELKRAQALFSEDEVEADVLDCWALGLTGPEARAKLGIAAKEYDAARKRMERKLRLLRGEGQ